MRPRGGIAGVRGRSGLHRGLLGRLCARRGLGDRSDHVGWGVCYNYSAGGDLLGIADSARGTVRYEMDAAHRLAAEQGPRGRLLYEHDAADNLVRVERDDAETWTAAYDAIGRRLHCGTPGSMRRFYSDGDRLAAEIEPDGRLRVYLYASHDALVPLGFVDYLSVDADPADGQEYLVTCDGAGMPLHVEDANREIVWWVDRVAPFGLLEVHESARIDYRLRWPGHYWDAELGLHYNRWHYYDPSLGRYLQPDPIGYRGSEVNLYGYCPNPLVGVCPTAGRCLTVAGTGREPTTRTSSASKTELAR